MSHPRRVLVTGANGFAGSHLLDLLAREDAQVFAWRRTPAGSSPDTPAISGSDPRWMAVDLIDRARVTRAVAEVCPTEIYHCAGAPHVGGSWQRVSATLAANVLATHHLLRALRPLPHAWRLLIPGSAMVYRPRDAALDEGSPIGPTSPYGISKLAQERLGLKACIEDHLQVVITRSFNHVGPRQDPSFAASGFARQIALIEAGLAEPVLRVGNLDARRDLTDVRDTVRAYRLLMERGRPGAPYNVCSGRAHRIGDLLDSLLSRARASVRIAVDPSLFRPNDLPVLLGSPARLMEETGWRPEYSIEQTLSDLLAYWRARIRS